MNVLISFLLLYKLITMITLNIISFTDYNLTDLYNSGNKSNINFSCLQRYSKKPLQTRKNGPQGLRDLKFTPR